MPEQPQTPIAPTPDQSFLLSQQDLAARRAKWREEGYTEADADEMVRMLKRLSEIQDAYKDSLKPDEYWTTHPDEKAEFLEQAQKFEEEKAEIGRRREELREELKNWQNEWGVGYDEQEQESDSKKGINNFLIDNVGIFVNGWPKVKPKIPQFKAKSISPQDLDYEALSKNSGPNRNRFGEYTLNPEMVGVDFEKAKVFIPDLSACVGKPLHEVLKYIAQTYGDRYLFPGLEFWQWALQNLDKAEKLEPKLKDGNLYHLPGSTICVFGDHWRLPYLHWEGNKWRHTHLSWLENNWISIERVLLLEK